MIIYFKIGWRWYDAWVGFYWNSRKKVLYFCPFPCLVIALSRDPDMELPP